MSMITSLIGQLKTLAHNQSNSQDEKTILLAIKTIQEMSNKLQKMEGK